MTAGYIAQVTGSAGNFVVAQIMQGTIAQAPAGQSGWVPVNISYPILDNVTQIMTAPILTAAADGLSVNMTFNTQNLPTAWAQMGLVNLATQQSVAKAAGGLTFSNIQLDTTETGFAKLMSIIASIQAGYTSVPYTFQETNGTFFSASLAQIQAAASAVSAFLQTNQNNRKACILAIQAGTITTSAQVLAAI